MMKQAPPKNLKIGLVQLKSQTNPAENLARNILEIKKLAQDGAQIICLSELFSSPYFCYEENHQFFDLAESIPGPSTEALSQVAKEHHCVIIASLFEKRAPGLYHNTVAVLDADGSYLGKYRKMHIPDDPGFYEKFYFTPGDLGYKVFQTQFAKIGVLICWDQWFPEAARLTALKGAEILFYPTAIGWDKEVLDPKVNQEEYQAWQSIQRSHAIANGIPVVSVNRVGEEEGTIFWGGSFVSNPFGTLLYQGSHHQEESPLVDIPSQASEHYRRIWPFLRDRRIDSYGEINQRFIDSEIE